MERREWAWAASPRRPVLSARVAVVRAAALSRPGRRPVVAMCRGGGGERGGGSGAHAAAVVFGGDGGQPFAGRLGEAAVAAAQQFGEAVDRSFADRRELVLEAVDEFARQRRRRDPRAARDVQLALQVAEHVRPLVGRDLTDLVADVVVQLADRDPAVLVTVGLAGLERLHDRAGEHRWPALAGQFVALERVLHGIGGGDDRAAAPAQVIAHVDAVAGPEPQPARDRAAVAAVEQHQHVVRAAAGHLAADELGRDRGRIQMRDLGVGGGEVELTAVVLEPMAGEVQQQQRVARPVAEERGDPPAQRGVALVRRQLDLEPADLGIAQDVGERLGVARRGAEPAQLRVAVRVGGDDQRVAAGHGDLTPRARSGTSRSSAAGRPPSRR